MGRVTLRKSNIRELIEEYPSIKLSKKDRVELDEDIIFVNNKPYFFILNEKTLPHLKLLLEKDLLKEVVVDMNAVKPLDNGADVMRPGILKLDESIKKDEFVVVKDERHGKPLCVCQALEDGESIADKESGKVLKNIHHVGDEKWNKK